MLSSGSCRQVLSSMFIKQDKISESIDKTQTLIEKASGENRTILINVLNRKMDDMKAPEDAFIELSMTCGCERP